MRLWGTILLAFNITLSFAQEQTDSTINLTLIDTVGQNKRVETIESYAKRFDPRKATLYAAVMPGLGQVYNKKYWKVPLVYGGFGFLIYVVDVYQDQYLLFRKDLFYVINTGNPSETGYTEDQLRTLVSRSRRERDYFIILTGIWYLLQMVDAQVDAHLKEFDLNPKLQVRIEPIMENSLLTGRSSGFSVKLRF